jgi:polysaccharide biosynthesis transport protein
MTFEQFFATLRARWKVALATLVLIAGGTVAVNMLLPPRYTATASLVIDAKPDPVSSMLYGGGPSPAYLATQINVLQSERVAARVVQTLKLAENPTMRSRWIEATDGKGDINVWVGNLLQQGLEVVPAKDSNVLSVSYDSAEPAFSAALANAFVQAYMDTTVDMRTDPAKQYSTFFDARGKQARERLEAAQTKLSAFQQDKGLVVTNERLDNEAARLNELSSQLVALQAVAVESRSRRSQANQSPESAGDVINNPIVAGLRSDLLRYETTLQEMNQRLGSNNPQVLELNARIAATKSRIESESRRVTSSVNLSSNTSDTRVAEVRTALEAQRDKLLRLKAVRDEAAVLERDVQGAQLAYDSIQSRLTATSIESQATMTNLYVLSRATEPSKPSSPKLVRNSLIAVCAGLLLAIGAALAVELFDRRVRTVDDIVTRFDLPVLGILPRPDARRLFRKERLSLMQERVVGRLPRSAPRTS